MHKKRGIIVTAVVLIVVLALVIIASEYHFYKNSGILLDALREMRSDSEKGFELCGQLTIDDFARDCYATYLSVEMENVIENNPDYENLEGEEKKEAAVAMLNEISEKVEVVCSIDVMTDSETCLQVPLILELQKEKVIGS